MNVHPVVETRASTWLNDQRESFLEGRMGYQRSDPESATGLSGKLANAIASMLRLGINHSDAARIQWQGAAQKYRERWAQGDLDAIAPVLSDLVTWLQRTGIDPLRNAEVRALLSDPVFEDTSDRIPSAREHSELLQTFCQLVSPRGK
jgi:hypothetical protein